MGLLENRNVIITGGSRGIGKAVAERFAKEGANIAFTYLHSKDRAAALEKELSALGVKAKAYSSDAGELADCEALVKNVMEDFGSIEVCINNAGISKDNLLLRLKEEEWDQVIRTNLKSIFNMTKNIIRPMMRARKGSIINMSSIIGLQGNAGQTSYAASKAGMIGFTKSIAKELGSRNIRCNAIAPGFVETEMTDYLKEGEVAAQYIAQIPLGRFAKGEDIADTALYLASDLSSYVTGQVISVCGGLHM